MNGCAFCREGSVSLIFMGCQTGDELMDRVYRALCTHHEKITRVQVTHTEMRDVVSGNGH